LSRRRVLATSPDLDQLRRIVANLERAGAEVDAVRSCSAVAGEVIPHRYIFFAMPDGNPASLIDISTVGAQVLSTAVLKPNQRLRMSLNDQAGDVRFRASVAWASFEISSKGPRYRAGIQFLDANAQQVDAYIARHK